MRLQARILLIVVPLIVAPLFTVGWLAYGQVRDTAEKQALDQIKTLLEQVRLQVRSEILNAQANLTVVANFSLLERYLVTEDEEERYTLMQPSLLRLFSDFQKTYPDYYEVRILLPDGYEDARSTVGDVANATDDEANTWYFPHMTAHKEDGGFFTAFFRNPDNGEIALLVSKPIALIDKAIDPLLAKPTIRGYLTFTIRLSALAEQVASARLGKRGHLLATDADGVVLFHPVKEKMGRRMNAAVFEVLRMSTEDTGRDVTMLIPLEGEDMLVLGHKLHENMYLFGMLPKQELNAVGERLGSIVALVIFVTIVLTIAVLFSLLKRALVRPIEELSKAALQIGRGNLSADVSIDEGGEIGELANSFREMGRNLQQSSEQIHYLAYHDSLTGLPNRSMFKEYLVDAIADARRNGQMIGLMYLDIDNFKQVNDTLGHQAGDEMLQNIATILTRCLREGDTVAVVDGSHASEMVARMGGDEFTVLLPNIRDPFAAGAVARRIQDRLQSPMNIAGSSLYASTSIGITMYPSDGEDVEDLIKCADIAMYHAKELGKNNYQYYAESMNVVAYQRASMENKLRRALDNREFFLEYQPIMDIATQTIVSVEALIRWRDPDVGLVPPDGFIPFAEESGLIVPIGEWVLQEACRQNKAWQSAGLAPICVSVNVSNIQVNRGDLVDVVTRSLDATGLAPGYLDVEITETSIMSAHEHAVITLNGLRDLGVRVSLDDFGTGYSSLSYLRHFPIDYLKIDRSFVREIIDNEKDAAIISTIIAMGHTLNMKVIAEGIETPQQLRFLQSRNCDYAQGYLLSRPVAASNIQALLANSRLRIA